MQEIAELRECAVSILCEKGITDWSCESSEHTPALKRVWDSPVASLMACKSPEKELPAIAVYAEQGESSAINWQERCVEVSVSLRIELYACEKEPHILARFLDEFAGQVLSLLFSSDEFNNKFGELDSLRFSKSSASDGRAIGSNTIELELIIPLNLYGECCGEPLLCRLFVKPSETVEPISIQEK